MPTNTCRHIKEDGVFCNNLPLQGRNYCYAHLLARGRQMRMAREALRQRLRPLFLPPLDDLNAVRNAISLLMAARTAERISERSLGLMLWGLQQAASILKFQACMPAAAGAGVNDQAQERVEAYPGFEREFGLPEDFDLSQPPEVAFPPQPVEAEPSPYRSNPWEMVNPEDIELEELLKTKGEEAYKKRQGEMEGKFWKQHDRKKRALDEARWLVEAHRRTYAPPVQRTKEEQRAYDLKVIADYEAKYPKKTPAASPDTARVEQAFRPASSDSSSAGALAPEGRDSNGKKPPLPASEIEIKAEAAQSGH